MKDRISVLNKAYKREQKRAEKSKNKNKALSALKYAERELQQGYMEKSMAIQIICNNKKS